MYMKSGDEPAEKGKTKMGKAKFWGIMLLIGGLLWPALGWGQVAPAKEGIVLEGKAQEPEEGIVFEEEKKKKEEVCEVEVEECPATFGPLFTDTAIPAAKGEFAIQATWLVPVTYGAYDGNWKRVDAGGDFVGFTQLVKFTYGLWDNLEVFLELSTYNHNWAVNVSEPGPRGERHSDFGGFGDTALVFKYGLLAETERRPQVTAFWGTVFPTGHSRHLNPGRLGIDELGGGSVDFVLGLNLQKWLKPFIFYGNVWYTMRTDYTADGENADGIATQVRIHPRDLVLINLAMEYPLTKRWVLLAEFLQAYEGGRLFGRQANQDPAAKISLVPGIEFMATDHLSMALGLNIDLAGKRDDANLTPTFSLVYLF
jgi:hypothetical protein